MAESIIVSGNTREEKYKSLLPQIKALAEDDVWRIAMLGNIMAALKYGMDFFWVGLYYAPEEGGDEDGLVLGPFQGPVACTRIGFGKGVCGTAWKDKKVIIVDDVNTFEGHIACSSDTKSEIVLPVYDKRGEVKMVLDVDSEHLANFTEVDEMYLKQVVAIIENTINN
jgi:GAF domain-containing protein